MTGLIYAAIAAVIVGVAIYATLGPIVAVMRDAARWRAIDRLYRAGAARIIIEPGLREGDAPCVGVVSLKDHRIKFYDGTDIDDCLNQALDALDGE